MRYPATFNGCSTALPEGLFSRIGKGMEVHFTPETEKKLKDLSAQSGRGADEVLQDALAGYFEEVMQTREILNSRYDDLKSGRVKPIPGNEVEAYFREKSTAARRSQPGS
jgi:predicted DNA-binding protein